MKRVTGWAVAAVLLAGACGGARGASSAGSGATPARGNSTLIVEAEVAGTGVTNALEAVQLLRPSMLRSRAGGASAGNPSGEPIAVYVDGVKMGGPESLAGVNALSVKEIRFINAADATTRYGTGHPSGAIMVVTKR